MKKKNIGLILALALVLALSCSAWAATTALVKADGIRIESKDQVYELVAPAGDYSHGLWALNAGSIDITANVKTEGKDARGATAQDASDIKLAGSITTSGGNNTAAFCIQQNSTGAMTGNLNILDGYFVRAIYANDASNVVFTGDLRIDSGSRSRGLYALSSSAIPMASGDITIIADESIGVLAHTNSYIKLFGNIVLSGDVITNESNAGGVMARESSSVDVTGSVTVLGSSLTTVTNGIYGLHVTADSTINLSHGTVSVSGDETAWAMGLTNGSATDKNTINLNSVVVDAENGNLVFCEEYTPVTGDVASSISGDASGSINAINSVLTGNILHDSTVGGTLATNLTDDSTWTGSAEVSGDVGAIDISLVSSDWIITGDTNTNGKVTADEDSNIDFRGADENIVVEIDNLAGAPGLNIKLDDVFTINNPDAADSFQSSDPSVVEVVKNADGSVSIIPRSDGDAELTYSYIDDNGKIQTVTIGVVSGAGSDPTGGGGGSSNCNSGVGAALFALLGLAFVYKKK